MDFYFVAPFVMPSTSHLFPKCFLPFKKKVCSVKKGFNAPGTNVDSCQPAQSEQADIGHSAS